MTRWWFLGRSWRIGIAIRAAVATLLESILAAVWCVGAAEGSWERRGRARRARRAWDGMGIAVEREEKEMKLASRFDGGAVAEASNGH